MSGPLKTHQNCIKNNKMIKHNSIGAILSSHLEVCLPTKLSCPGGQGWIVAPTDVPKPLLMNSQAPPTLKPIRKGMKAI